MAGSWVCLYFAHEFSSSYALSLSFSSSEIIQCILCLCGLNSASDQKSPVQQKCSDMFDPGHTTWWKTKTKTLPLDVCSLTSLRLFSSAGWRQSSAGGHVSQHQPDWVWSSADAGGRGHRFLHHSVGLGQSEFGTEAGSGKVRSATRWETRLRSLQVGHWTVLKVSEYFFVNMQWTKDLSMTHGGEHFSLMRSCIPLTQIWFSARV